MKKGKLIVIDGNDGSGKATQTALLVKALRKKGYKVRTFDFPHYDNFFGALVGKCLRGECGDFVAMNPRVASVLYAADRWESSKMIHQWIKDGYVVVLDRYVSANQIHQGGKIKDEMERREFLRWLAKMEFEVFGIPKPDIIIYLNMPTSLNMKLAKQKATAGGKGYLNGKRDLHETNRKFLNNSRESALEIVRQDNKWHRIDCAEGKEIISIEDIHKEVFNNVNKILK